MEPITATKLTIYTGDSDKHGHKPLHLAIIELLHAEGISGATVLHGIEGFGSHKQIHTARILDLSGDLPEVIIAVDLPEKIEVVLPRGRASGARRDDRGGPRHDRRGANRYLPPAAATLKGPHKVGFVYLHKG